MVLKFLTLTLAFNLFLKFVAVEAAINFKLPAVVLPVFTPFADDPCLSLNLSVIPAYAKKLKKDGVKGILVAGTSGEGVQLNLEERMELANAWVQEAKPLGIMVLYQVGGLPSMDIFRLVKYVVSIGVDGLVSLPYLYNKATNAQKAVSDLKQIATCAPNTPIIYYDHPKESGVKLNMVDFFTLATEQIPTFGGVKCYLETAIEITSHTYLRSYQSIMVSNYQSVQGAFELDYNTTTATMVNLFPQIIFGIKEAVDYGDKTRASGLQSWLNLIQRTIVATTEGAISQMKAAFAVFTGLDVGGTRYPLPKITRVMKKNITTQLEGLGIELMAPVR